MVRAPRYPIALPLTQPYGHAKRLCVSRCLMHRHALSSDRGKGERWFSLGRDAVWCLTLVIHAFYPHTEVQTLMNVEVGGRSESIPWAVYACEPWAHPRLRTCCGGGVLFAWMSEMDEKARLADADRPVRRARQSWATPTENKARRSSSATSSALMSSSLFSRIGKSIDTCDRRPC